MTYRDWRDVGGEDGSGVISLYFLVLSLDVMVLYLEQQTNVI